MYNLGTARYLNLMPEERPTAILLLSCPDREGLVSSISGFLADHGGNILDLDEHVDPQEKIFFIRVVWDMTRFDLSAEDLPGAFEPLGREFGAHWKIQFANRSMRVAIFVSRYDHCLQEILWRQNLGEYAIEIPLIISNHPDLESIAVQYNIPFYHFPISKENKQEQEKEELKLLKEQQVECIVLARYMQILTSVLPEAYPNRIINIHHSFLPAFKGGNPYRQAYDRGVKIIGATSHYVTEILDEGPIIEQEIIHISHKDSIKDLSRKGRDLERLVLARALKYHAEHRILVHGKKTIVFD